jgi:hypothetical protein
MKKLPIVEVEWVDSRRNGGWSSREDYMDVEVPDCRSAGYLLTSNRKHIVLVLNQDDANGNVCDSMTIPRSAIRKVTRLEHKR